MKSDIEWAQEASRLYLEYGSMAKAMNEVLRRRQEERTLDDVYILPILRENEGLGINKAQESFTQYLNKTQEEYEEVVEEISWIEAGDDRYSELAQELLDEVQLRLDLLNILDKQKRINLLSETLEHFNKLIRRGWTIEEIFSVQRRPW